MIIYKTIKLLGLILLSLSIGLAEDLFVELNNTTGKADYLLGSKLVENASYGSSTLGLSSIISDNARGYFDLSHTQIYPQTEYSSSQVELGLQFRYLEIEDNQLFYGLHGFANRYHDNYSYYDNSGLAFYGKWKHYFQAGHLTTFGYDFEAKRFAEVEEASNSVHEFFAAYNRSFQTKSSLQLRSSIALQDFLAQTSISGRGRNLFTTVTDIPSNYLTTTELRLSQSLGSKFGFTLWLENQTLLNETADSLVLQDGIENPFTDRFRWEGSSSAMRLMYRHSPQSSFQISHSYLNKKYMDVPVYLFDFDAMDYVVEDDELVHQGYDRQDERNHFQFRWNKYWAINNLDWMSEIELVLTTGLTQNNSNDVLYDYESMDYSISVNFNY